MKIVSKFASRKRIRIAARRLGDDPSPQNYVALAREHVIAGNTPEVLRVCTEGLQMHPGHDELARLADRARQLELDTRVRTLYQELEGSPRPALWRQLCSVLLDSDRLERADEAAQRWFESTGEGEALYYRASIRSRHFFRDHGAEDGRTAFELAGQARRLMSADPRPLRLQLEIASRSGAYEDARKCLAQLLELVPGDQELEARFRTTLAMCEQSKPLETALHHVERNGRFVDDVEESSGPSTTNNVAVRPLLQQLGSDADVQAAVYLRGATALVQGLHGATAERTARVIRELVQGARSGARRMSLGRPVKVLLEGDFGSLLLAPGERGSSALWCQGGIKHRHEDLLRTLTGVGHLAPRNGGRR